MHHYCPVSWELNQLWSVHLLSSSNWCCWLASHWSVTLPDNTENQMHTWIPGHMQIQLTHFSIIKWLNAGNCSNIKSFFICDFFSLSNLSSITIIFLAWYYLHFGVWHQNRGKTMISTQRECKLVQSCFLPSWGHRVQNFHLGRFELEELHKQSSTTMFLFMLFVLFCFFT